MIPKIVPTFHPMKTKNHLFRMRKTGVPKKNASFFSLVDLFAADVFQGHMAISDLDGFLKPKVPSDGSNLSTSQMRFVTVPYLLIRMHPPILSLSQIEGKIGCGVVAIDDCLPPMLPAGSRIPNPV